MSVQYAVVMAIFTRLFPLLFYRVNVITSTACRPLSVRVFEILKYRWAGYTGRSVFFVIFFFSARLAGGWACCCTVVNLVYPRAFLSRRTNVHTYETAGARLEEEEKEGK